MENDGNCGNRWGLPDWIGPMLRERHPENIYMHTEQLRIGTSLRLLADEAEKLRLEWERMPSQARLAALTKPHPRIIKTKKKINAGYIVISCGNHACLMNNSCHGHHGVASNISRAACSFPVFCCWQKNIKVALWHSEVCMLHDLNGFGPSPKSAITQSAYFGVSSQGSEADEECEESAARSWGLSRSIATMARKTFVERVGPGEHYSSSFCWSLVVEPSIWPWRCLPRCCSSPCPLAAYASTKHVLRDRRVAIATETCEWISTKCAAFLSGRWRSSSPCWVSSLLAAQEMCQEFYLGQEDLVRSKRVKITLLCVNCVNLSYG